MKVQPIFGIENWTQQHKRESKYVGSLILALGMALSIYYTGLAAGLLLYLIVFMLLSNLIILLIPLGIVNKWNFIGLALFSILVELFI